MGFDEILFHSINGFAGRLSLLDWVMVELAKPGNLLYPVLRPIGSGRIAENV